jgi:Amt family ammonium transporter
VLGTIAVAAFIYPVFVHWAWGNALWSTMKARRFWPYAGFVDFAGSTVVHGTGAWVALAACLLIGPRRGRFDDANGKPVRIQGHSPVLATAGAFSPVRWLDRLQWRLDA